MDRLDYYDIMPKGMDAYLSNHGFHFSKPMLEWAVGMMRDRNGKKVELVDRKKIDEVFSNFGISLKQSAGYYDVPYTWAMAKADYYGSSILDEMKLALFVRDTIDDPDGTSTKVFDHFLADCNAKGINIPWEDMI